MPMKNILLGSSIALLYCASSQSAEHLDDVSVSDFQKTISVVNSDSSSNLRSQGYITGGGVSGNEKLGLNCLTPSPGSMKKCLSYQSQDGNFELEDDFPRHEITLQLENHRHLIFKEFNGYPHVVKRELVDDEYLCSMENPFVKTIIYHPYTSEQNVVQYACDDSGEYFDQERIDRLYWHFFSFSEANQAHFFAGLTMQMLYQYFNELFPDQVLSSNFSPQCNQNFCLKQLQQRINGPTISHTAEWDGEYVNYSQGSGDFYSWTTMDVVAHEIGHAVMQWNNTPLADSDGNRNAKTLNEAFSDVISAALKDYFTRAVSGDYEGSYKNSLVFYEQTEEKKWWASWDIIYAGENGEYDGGIRYFHWPSWDGGSINDVRDVDVLPFNSYYRGGPIRKFYYLLTDKAGWSHSDAIKLFLLANLRCMKPNSDFNELGSCLISQVDDVFSHQKLPLNGIESLDYRKNQVDQSLKTVGIFPENGASNALELKYNRSYRLASYQIKNLFAENDIKTLDVDWGDGNNTSWDQASSSESVDLWLNGEHTYDKSIDEARLSVELTLNSSGKLYYFSKHQSLRSFPCVPEIRSAGNSIEFVQLLGQQHTASTSGYTELDVRSANLRQFLNEGLTIGGNLFNKQLTYYIDKNKNDVFEDDEKVSSQVWQDSSSYPNLPLLDLQDLDEGLVKLRVIVSNNSLSSSCESLEGSVVDILLKVGSQVAPPSSNFSYEINDKTVIFTVQPDAKDDPSSIDYHWSYTNASGEKMTFNLSDAGDYTFPAYGNYQVSLTVSKNDLSSNSVKNLLIEQPYCVPVPWRNNHDPRNFYIDSINVSSEEAWIIRGGIHNNNENSADMQNYQSYYNHPKGQWFDIYKGRDGQADIKQTIVVGSGESSALTHADINYVRAMLWIDDDRNGSFDSDEVFFSDINDVKFNCTNSHQCSIQARIHFIANKVSGVDQSGTEIPFKARIRFERFRWMSNAKDTNRLSNACRSIGWGEIEDLNIYVGYKDQ